MEHNLRYVVSRARRYKNDKIELLDLIQVGNQGLMKAVDKFDCEKGYRLTTYATCWIDREISQYIQDASYTIRKPVDYNKKYNKLKKAIEELSRLSVNEPSYEEISNYTGLKIDEIKQIFNDFADTVSLSEPVGDESDAELGDFIEDDKSLSVEEQVELNTNIELIEELIKIANLTKREEEVIKLRFGIVGDYPHTLEEVGKIYGVSKETIRRIETKCIRMLKAAAARKKKQEERIKQSLSKTPKYKPVKNKKSDN